MASCWIMFIIGMFVGCWIGAVSMALLAASGRFEDKENGIFHGKYIKRSIEENRIK